MAKRTKSIRQLREQAQRMLKEKANIHGQYEEKRDRDRAFMIEKNLAKYEFNILKHVYKGKQYFPKHEVDNALDIQVPRSVYMGNSNK